MAEFDNTNRGALFKNKDRQNDKQPEYKGSINIQGVEYWLSAWVKDGKSGKFFSLSVQPKEKQAPKPAPQAHDDMDDDIPF
jgi:hypothetical protein